MHLDAGNSSSYSGTGTTWSDLSGNGNHATLVNGPTYSSADGGAIVFDGSNDYASTNIQLPNRPYTVSIWANYHTPFGSHRFIHQLQQLNTYSTAFSLHLHGFPKKFAMYRAKQFGYTDVQVLLHHQPQRGTTFVVRFLQQITSYMSTQRLKTQ